MNKTLACLLFTLSSLAHAEGWSGLWETVNDRTGQVEALVRLTDKQGALEGTVEKVYAAPAQEADPICDACPGDYKNKHVVGMVILHAKTTTDSSHAEGDILDPDEGRVYKCKLRLLDDGGKLEVRGFVGLALFGRTQVWRRH